MWDLRVLLFPLELKESRITLTRQRSCWCASFREWGGANCCRNLNFVNRDCVFCLSWDNQQPACIGLATLFLATWVEASQQCRFAHHHQWKKYCASSNCYRHWLLQSLKFKETLKTQIFFRKIDEHRSFHEFSVLRCETWGPWPRVTFSTLPSVVRLTTRMWSSSFASGSSATQAPRRPPLWSILMHTLPDMRAASCFALARCWFLCSRWFVLPKSCTEPQISGPNGRGGKGQGRSRQRARGGHGTEGATDDGVERPSRAGVRKVLPGQPQRRDLLWCHHGPQWHPSNSNRCCARCRQRFPGTSRWTGRCECHDQNHGKANAWRPTRGFETSNFRLSWYRKRILFSSLDWDWWLLCFDVSHQAPVLPSHETRTQLYSFPVVCEPKMKTWSVLVRLCKDSPDFPHAHLMFSDAAQAATTSNRPTTSSTTTSSTVLRLSLSRTICWTKDEQSTALRCNATARRFAQRRLEQLRPRIGWSSCCLKLGKYRVQEAK